MISRAVTLVCLLGEVAVALIKLFSDSRTSAQKTGGSFDPAAFRRDVAFTFVSCALSLATLLLSVLGFKKVLRAARSTVRRMSVSAARAVASGRGARRAAGAGNATGNTSRFGLLSSTVHAGDATACTDCVQCPCQEQDAEVCDCGP